MPLRPFPLPLRVGTDICSAIRIKAVITRGRDTTSLRPLSQFISRVLTKPEQKYFWDRFGPPEHVHSKLNSVAQFLAGRFAAKEACRKACHHFDKNARGFHQIMILPITAARPGQHQSSSPQGLILDKIYDANLESECRNDGHHTVKSTDDRSVALEDLDGQLCEISISHDEGFATAVALVPIMEK